MNYIVLDMEWNQPCCLKMRVNKPVVLHGEIVQIGAVKLDDDCKVIDTFKTMISPKYYTKMNKKVMKLTGITTQQLKSGVPFAYALESFKKWCGNDCVLLTWGPDDIRILQSNIVLHNLTDFSLPACYDVQMIYCTQTKSEKKQTSLLEAMELLNIPALEAHDALNDAKNTACICEHLDLKKGISEYMSMFNYLSYDGNQFGESRKSAKLYDKRYDTLKDADVVEFACPICAAKVVCSEPIRQNFDKFISLTECEKGHGLFVRFKITKTVDKKYRISRVIYQADEELEAFFEDKKKEVEEFKKKISADQ